MHPPTSAVDTCSFQVRLNRVNQLSRLARALAAFYRLDDVGANMILNDLTHLA